MSNRLEGKIALVTGGSAGIGAECCKRFAAEGAKVVAGDMNPLSYEAENVEYIKLNVTDTANCQQVVDEIIAKHGKIDILVNNAGITRDALVQKMTDAMWDAVINVNLKGVFNTTRIIGPIMMQNGYGSIINISSVVGEYGNIGQTNYAATKAGVIGMTKTWAKEFARKGANVRTNAIAPGYVMTDILKTVPQELLDKFAALTMLGRLGQPEEIANAALFLASAESSYVTGHVLSVNGGMRL
ncbi:MAG: beta-ketoacyl-ACP reductase [Oscillospiraceae bacterium]|jgi:3-oxoacyl-[acyl-carrier protein] reductase|nr:beta-ketoacyl-ACP reductase [Oscillospiraceae bacterium]